MLKSRIPLIIAHLDDTMLEGLKEAAEQVAEGARERVPIDSGALRDAIHVETENGVSIVAGDDQAFYGHIVENGGVYTPAQPFLIPALEAERDSIEDIIGEKLEDI